MQDKIRLLAQYLGGERVRMRVDLGEVFSARLEQEADGFYIATSVKELVNVIRACQDLKLDYIVLGLGTRVRLSQKYFPGLVIKNRSDNIRVFGIRGKVSSLGIGVEEAMIESDSGVSLSKLSEFLKQQNLMGFDGIADQGTLGGMLADRPGLAFPEKVKIIGSDGQVQTKELDQLKKGEIILSAIFKLKARQK